VSIVFMMRGTLCGISSPQREHFAVNGMQFSSYVIRSSGSDGITEISGVNRKGGYPLCELAQSPPFEVGQFLARFALG
jgi:hypothetical protein